MLTRLARRLQTVSRFKFGKRKRNITENVEFNVKRLKQKEPIKDIKGFKGFIDDSIKSNTLQNKIIKGAK
jgi:hypothetical protein